MRPSGLLSTLTVVAVLAAACKSDDKSSGEDTRPVASGPPKPADAGPGPIDARVHARRVKVVAVGDINFGRYFMDMSYVRVSTAARPFADVEPILHSADIALGNLECPIVAEPDQFHVTSYPGLLGTDRGRPSLTFRAEPQDAVVMARAGFTVMSLANNHARDMGSAGPAGSREAIELAGIHAIGAGIDASVAQRPAIIQKNGLRIAVMAWTVWLKGLSGVVKESAVATISNGGVKNTLSEEIRRAKQELRADFVIASLHWGFENKPHADSSQTAAARAFIDAGADLVAGHHPHVVQDFEIYKGGVIAYSLGNFMFDSAGQMRRRSVILEATFDGADGAHQVLDVTLHPVLIRPGTHVPKLARGQRYIEWARALREKAPGFEIAPPPQLVPNGR